MERLDVLGGAGRTRAGAGWLAGALIAVAGIAVTVGGGAARAETSCSEGGEDGTRTCTAGIRSEMVQATIANAGEQRMSQWCWAASIAMVFRYYGYEVSQARIVAETFGQVANVPGSAQQIAGALGRAWTDDRGRTFRVMAAPGTPATATEDLAAGRPLIVGTYGHAMVLTALEYAEGPWGGEGAGEGFGANITRAIVRDPWPGRGRRGLSAEEWYGADFLARISVVRVGGE